MNILKFALLVATRDFKNRPVFTDLKIQPCKSFIALATGELVCMTSSATI